MKKLIKINDVLARIPYSRSQIYNMIAEGRFPTPVHLGGRASFWVESEIDEWIQRHIEAERRFAQNEGIKEGTLPVFLKLNY